LQLLADVTGRRCCDRQGHRRTQAVGCNDRIGTDRPEMPPPGRLAPFHPADTELAVLASGAIELPVAGRGADAREGAGTRVREAACIAHGRALAGRSILV